MLLLMSCFFSQTISISKCFKFCLFVVIHTIILNLYVYLFSLKNIFIIILYCMYSCFLFPFVRFGGFFVLLLLSVVVFICTIWWLILFLFKCMKIYRKRNSVISVKQLSIILLLKNKMQYLLHLRIYRD